MNLRSKNRTQDADFKTVTLLDVLNKFKREDFFTQDQSFYLIKVIDENHLIFGSPRSKITPKQIHEFKYLDKEKKIFIKSKYKHLFFSGFLIYALPLIPMILGWNELNQESLEAFGLVILGITLYILIAAYAGLDADSKNIEREITLRVNYLLRQKGHKMNL